MQQPTRIMLKLSGEVMKGTGQDAFDFSYIGTLVDKIIAITERNIQVSIVVGAGNVWRFRDNVDSKMDRVKSDNLGMMATFFNAVILADQLVQHGVKSVVYGTEQVTTPILTTAYNALHARDDMENKKVVICAGGTGDPYHSTDSAAVLRALELQCDVLVKATKVDGVYDKDPMKYDDAVKFDTLTLQKANELGVKIMDHTAIAMALENNLPMFVCNVTDLEKFGTDDISGTTVTMT